MATPLVAGNPSSHPDSWCFRVVESGMNPAPQTGMTSAIRMVAADGPKGRWKYLLIARDECALILEMTPAPLGGWSVLQVVRQGADDWPGMTADQIATWWKTKGGMRDADEWEAEFVGRWLRR